MAGNVEHILGTETLTLHHIGCAVKSIPAAVDYYTRVMGFKQTTESIEVPSQRVRVCFIEIGPNVFLELVEAAGQGSPVERVLADTGGGPYHLCYRVDDLDAAIERLRAQGFFRLKRFELAAHGMKRFAFMLTPDRQLFELCEPEKSQGLGSRV
jgi:methylmalonyl-CoA/ethylmalonyl-CoA epimerase